MRRIQNLFEEMEYVLSCQFEYFRSLELFGFGLTANVN